MTSFVLSSKWAIRQNGVVARAATHVDEGVIFDAEFRREPLVGR